MRFREKITAADLSHFKLPSPSLAKVQKPTSVSVETTITQTQHTQNTPLNKVVPRKENLFL